MGQRHDPPASTPMDPDSTSPAFVALTGDLVASRLQPPESRTDVQQKVLGFLEGMNGKLGDQLARPLVLTAGDEIQGLLRVPSEVVRIIQELRDFLDGATEPGQEIVFGIGRGTLSTGLLPEARYVGQLDGPCFHRARSMLERAKKERIWATFEGFGELEDVALNSLFELMGAIRDRWTLIQSKTALHSRRLGKRIEVARYLGVSPSVVTESLQASRFRAVENGEAAARRILARFDPQTLERQDDRGDAR